jgi:prephenate dehydrogenase
MKKLNELKVLIVGLGQIGGSIGLDLVEQGVVAEVVGFDKNPAVSREAVAQNVIHRAAHSLEEAIRKSDLVILAAPIREIIRLIPAVCESLSESAAILDTAGTKGEILDIVSKCGRRVNYVGGHPMAGDERSGLESAQRGKFVGCTFILTPSEDTDQEWFYTVMHLITRLRAKPVMMSAEEHDRLIALTSHLPYALSLALLNTAAGATNGQNNVRSCRRCHQWTEQCSKPDGRQFQGHHTSRCFFARFDS